MNKQYIKSKKNTAEFARRPYSCNALILKKQRGYALLTLAILLMIVGVMSAGALNISNTSEHLASNAIQRNRAFQAADAATYYAEAEIASMLKQRVFASDSGTKGLFTFENRPNDWWNSSATEGIHKLPESTVLGVVNPPRYSIEQVGDYVSDGGTGVVNLDIGGTSYGRMTSGGREIILFNVQSHANGSFNEVKTVVETAVAISY